MAIHYKGPCQAAANAPSAPNIGDERRDKSSLTASSMANAATTHKCHITHQGKESRPETMEQDHEKLRFMHRYQTCSYLPHPVTIPAPFHLVANTSPSRREFEIVSQRFRAELLAELVYSDASAFISRAPRRRMLRFFLSRSWPFITVLRPTALATLASLLPQDAQQHCRLFPVTVSV